MSIPIELLKATEGNAVGTLTYGGPEMWKTFAIHTLPPPILLFDFEQGTGSLIPWVRRRRRWDSNNWLEYTDADREQAAALVVRPIATPVKPSPYVDVISYNNMNGESYTKFSVDIAEFDPSEYNSIALDSIGELNFSVQTFAKARSGRELDSEMELQLWGGVQERTAIQLRKLRNYRNAGVFIYITGGEHIDKEYVIDPRAKPKGMPAEEPFSVKGSVQVAGQLVGVCRHITDLMAHARLQNGKVTWVFSPEAITAGNASWEAKDRFGRLEKFEVPNFRSIFNKIYGEEGRKEIYAECQRQLQKNS